MRRFPTAVKFAGHQQVSVNIISKHHGIATVKHKYSFIPLHKRTQRNVLRTPILTDLLLTLHGHTTASMSRRSSDLSKSEDLSPPSSYKSQFHRVSSSKIN